VSDLVSAAVHVGVIGLGGMGRPMARNLVAAGYAVSGCDISTAAVEAAGRDGVEPARSPAALAARCELILAMVWDDAALREVVFGDEGLLSADGFAGCFVDLSTTSRAIALEIGAALSKRGAVFLDAAVIGGGVAAVKAARSPIVVSGDAQALQRYRGVLERLGTCDYVGALGNAKAVKLINNFLVGAITAANAEALSLASALGLDIRDALAWLRDGTGGSRVLDSYYGGLVEQGRYPEGLIGHKLMAKDLQLAAELAESVDCAAVLPRFSQQMYLAFGRMLGAEAPFPTALDYFQRTNVAASHPAAASR
jgi:3-hydroxyisobutyrate dehydrogenase-like beta-hydroxyacid dehydrogenase